MLRTFFIILAIFGFLNLRGQETVPGQLLQHYQQFEQLYGLDQNLVNGVRYIPEYPGSEGHPFFEEGPFSYGALQVGPEVYGNVLIAYNVYKQNIVLQYTSFVGGPEMIILRNQHIQSFRLGLRKFEKLDLGTEGEKFYQVVDGGGLKCYYHWTKIMNRSTTPGGSFYIFSTLKRKFFLLKEGEVYSFKSKGSFLKLFEAEHHKAIKSYLRVNRIRMKKISDRDMIGLLQLCNDLL